MITLGEDVVAAMRCLSAYAEASGLSREEILQTRVVATCTKCGFEGCLGFQIISEDQLLPWRNEKVLIRNAV